MCRQHWTATTQRSATGSYSAYCDDTAPAGGPYSTGVYSWMRAGPFDLSGASTAFLEYSAWIENHSGDYLAVLFNKGDAGGPVGSFYGFSYLPGAATWFDESIDLSDIPVTGDSMLGESNVYLAFIFSSDTTATGPVASWRLEPNRAAIIGGRKAA